MGHPHRFYVPPQDIIKNQVVIKGDECQHARRTLRLVVDDIIEVLDGIGNIYTVKLTEVKKSEITGNIINRCNKKDTAVKIVLGQGIPKSRKMDIIIQKAVELGANEIIPILTARTVVKTEAGSNIKKRARWQRIAYEAIKQCRRPHLPFISEIVTLESFCKSQEDSFFKVVLWEEEGIRLHEALEDVADNDNINRVSIIIGPEGGLENVEIETAKGYGFIPVRLGQNILRTETASIAVLSIMQFMLRNIG